MKFPENKKKIKIISLLLILIGILIIILFYVYSKVFPVYKFSGLSSGNTNSQISGSEEKKVDSMIDEAIKAQINRTPEGKEEEFILNKLGTTQEHWKDLGIANAKISGEEEKNLYLMTIESIKAQLEYYSTKKEESLDKVKSLFLPSAFAQYKEYVKQEAVLNNSKKGIQSYGKIETVEFSKPRVYKDLSGRVGIVTSIEFFFIADNTNNLASLFVFKNINGEWKIEKQKEIIVRLDVEENMLIQKIKDGK